ncbi:hypothetical protein ILYODFUR_032641 [Ilyodon furcidens]|uniref:Uncharacterized protein n=1 Tax=Ilyodon furcidens TaxID=33524 RepID=A0ABV0TD63_9TELE
MNEVVPKTVPVSVNDASKNRKSIDDKLLHGVMGKTLSTVNSTPKDFVLCVIQIMYLNAVFILFFSDKLEPVEEKAQFPKKALTKTKAGTWYPSQAKQYEPLCVSKNVGLFQEYQKKYKEKTCKSMDE